MGWEAHPGRGFGISASCQIVWLGFSTPHDDNLGKISRNIEFLCFPGKSQTRLISHRDLLKSSESARFPIFLRNCRDRTRGNGSKWREGRLRWDIGRNPSLRGWHRWGGEKEGKREDKHTLQGRWSANNFFKEMLARDTGANRPCHAGTSSLICTRSTTPVWIPRILLREALCSQRTDMVFFSSLQIHFGFKAVFFSYTHR